MKDEQKMECYTPATPSLGRHGLLMLRGGGEEDTFEILLWHDPMRDNDELCSISFKVHVPSSICGRGLICRASRTFVDLSIYVLIDLPIGFPINNIISLRTQRLPIYTLYIHASAPAS